MIYIIATIIVLGILVFVHELGHFLAAKATGIRVETFSLGFPPKIVCKKWGETEYCLSWIPLGGYVKLSGMIDESLDESWTETEPQPWEYRAKPGWVKVLVSSAGVIMNLFLAVIIFSVLTFQNGIAVPAEEPVIGEVVSGMPAESAGLQKGDRILSINGHPVDTWEEMTVQIQALADQEIQIELSRDHEILQVTLTPVPQQSVVDGDIKTVGMIGVSADYSIRQAGMFESVKYGFRNTGYWLNLTVKSLGMVITGKESLKNIGGPIMIAQLAGESAKTGAGALFGFIAIISVNLAFINILPIPALDGGHIVVAVTESILRRELRLKTKIRIQQAGMAILFTLIALVLVNDIFHLFNGS
ncbi:MAG: RIP metalloprotease RseP [Fidelibacterota bacterium]